MAPAFAALEAQHRYFYPPRYTLLVNQQDLLRAGVEVMSVTVNEVLDGASRVSFTVLDRELKWLNASLFEPGARVEVYMGYTNSLERLFIGEITEIRPTFPPEGVCQLDIAGHDLSHQMSRGCPFRSWEDMTDSQIAEAIAGEYGLEPSGVQQTTHVRPKIKQNGESDLEFLRKRADKQRQKFEVLVRDTMLIFAEPQDEDAAPLVTRLKWGESLISFTPELNTAGQVSEVTVRGWNPMAKQEIVGRARWPDVRGTQPGVSGGELVEKLYTKSDECVRMEPVYTQREADERASAVLKERADMFVTGSGESMGIPEIRVRCAMILDGLGPFSMKYYITGTTHTISGTGGYKTMFTVKSITYNPGDQKVESNA